MLAQHVKAVGLGGTLSRASPMHFCCERKIGSWLGPWAMAKGRQGAGQEQEGNRSRTLLGAHWVPLGSGPTTRCRVRWETPALSYTFHLLEDLGVSPKVFLTCFKCFHQTLFKLSSHQVEKIGRFWPKVARTKTEIMHQPRG